jgi:hypothetical protein
MGDRIIMSIDHLFNRMFMADLELAMAAMTVPGLERWKQHVIDNPYSLEGVSKRMIEILDGEIAKRKL